MRSKHFSLPIPVAHQKLQNYLRTHRRRHNLSQADVAMLLGAASGTKVSRYENFTRMPGPLTVFAFEIVFNQPASELFAGSYETIRLAVQERARRLVKQLTAQPDAKTGKNLRKLELLRSIVEPKPSPARRG
jgi:transcriptional regulator with XRE-family HTH domain